MWATAAPDELRVFVDEIGHGFLVVDVEADGTFRWACFNKRFEATVGGSLAWWIGRTPAETLPPDRARLVLARYRYCVASRRSLEYEECMRIGDRTLWIRAALTPVVDEHGVIKRVLGSLIDITPRQRLEAELRRAARELRDSQRRFRVAMRGAELGLWEWHIPSARLTIHDEWAPNLAFSGEWKQQTMSAWIRATHPADRAVAIEIGERIVNRQLSNYTIRYRVRAADGQWRWVQVYGSVVERDADGRPVLVSGTFRDVDAEQRRIEAMQQLTEELHYRALHDSLTDALNHGAILDRLREELERARREGGAVTVAMIDADHFKEINDGYGHQAGDEVLFALVQRIRGVLRAYDHLGRYGGEEFLVVAPGRSAVADLQERIRGAVADSPFETAAGPLSVTVSIGVAVACARTNPYLTFESLIRAADDALYRAKQAGRNQVVVAEGIA